MFEWQYPANLLQEIYGSHVRVPTIHMENFNAEIRKLSKNYQRYINNRYREHKSRKECGEILGLPVHKIEALEERLTNLLRNKKDEGLFDVVSLYEHNTLKNKARRLDAENKQLRAQLLAVKNGELMLDEIQLISTQDVQEDIDTTVLMNTPIEELDLTMRTMRACQRGKIKTVRDLAMLTPDEFVQQCRGAGPVVKQEVETALSAVGTSFCKQPKPEKR